MSHVIVPEDLPVALLPFSRHLQEIHLDFLLLEELETNPGFARHFFELAFGADDLPLPTSVHARRSVWDAGGENCPLEHFGENDLDVTASWDGFERRILVEDKLSANFQPGQPEGYRARARNPSRPPETRCLLVAPREYIKRHPGAVEIFRGCGDAVAIEDLAEDIEAGARELEGPLARRLMWRAAVLRGFTVGPPRPPDHEPTIAFSGWCIEWLAKNAPGVVLYPIRCITQGWFDFRAPQGLLYKCTHGAVDLQVNRLRMNPLKHDPGVDEVRRRVGDTLPPGFVVTLDKSRRNTVLHYGCELVSPQGGIGIDCDPVQLAGVKDGLAACVAISAWLERYGRDLLIDETIDAGVSH